MIQKVQLFSFLLLLLFFFQEGVGITQTPIQSVPQEQDFQQSIDILNYKPELLEYLILKELGVYRTKASLDPYEAEIFLQSAAGLLCEQNRESEDVREFDPKEVNKLFESEGYPPLYRQLSMRSSLRSGPDFHSYASLAKAVIEYWDRSTKTRSIMLEMKDRYAGISAQMTDDKRKIYVSLITSSVHPFQSQTDLESLPVEVSKHSAGLDSYDEKICKKLDRVNLHRLKNSIQVEDKSTYVNQVLQGNRSIYFEFDDIRTLRRIIKADSRDGLAVDIIQKEQYPFNGPNLIDYATPHRGILTEPIYGSDLYELNEIQGKEGRKKIRLNLGQIPEEIKDYELHLVIIKDNCFCQSMPIASSNQESFRNFNKIETLADTITLYNKVEFYPEAVSDEFMFRIPFEDKIDELTCKEIAPYLEDFQVPPFIIKKVSIAAFNSCDRSSNRDMIALHKKAETIVQAMQEKQEEKIEADIMTSNGWTLFRDDVIGTPYEPLAFLSEKDAIRSFGQYKSDTLFQNILSKHRFAQVQLDVIYDIRGSKEQEYVIYHFNKAVEKENTALALSIQKYMIHKLLAGEYTEEAVVRQKIPFDKLFSGLWMNKIWLQHHLGIIDEDALHSTVLKLHQIDPVNPYIKFNALFAQMSQNPIVEEYDIFKVQTAIEELYESTLSKETVDALNLDFQFKLLSWMDTLDDKNNQTELSLEKIKTIASNSGSDAASTLQLAYLFVQYYDYDFALNLLEPYILSENANEEMLFAYLSMSNFVSDKFFTRSFEKCVESAAAQNPKKFCEWYQDKKISLMSLENPAVKSLVTKTCTP